MTVVMQQVDFVYNEKADKISVRSVGSFSGYNIPFLRSSDDDLEQHSVRFAYQPGRRAYIPAFLQSEPLSVVNLPSARLL